MPSKGIIITEAITRGTTSASAGTTPIVRMASISSVIFIVPIWAAKAEPERPATMIAVIRMPNSRSVSRPMRLMVNISAPNCRSWTAPCCAITIPIRKLIRPTMPSARTPTMSKCCTTACQRKRPGFIIKMKNAFTTCPTKPRNCKSVVTPITTPPPTSAKKRLSDDTCGLGTASAASTPLTASIKRPASLAHPVMSAA